MQKEFYRSKTFWLNAVTITLGIVEVVTKTYPISMEVIALINGFGNMFLRLISSDVITFGGRVLFKKQ